MAIDENDYKIVTIYHQCIYHSKFRKTEQETWIKLALTHLGNYTKYHTIKKTTGEY